MSRPMPTPQTAGERRLVRFSFFVFACYVPLETYASWPALWNPFYLVDAIGMTSFCGASIRSSERPSGAS